VVLQPVLPVLQPTLSTERGKGGRENHIYSKHSELLEAEAEDWHASYWQ